MAEGNVPLGTDRTERALANALLELARSERSAHRERFIPLALRRQSSLRREPSPVCEIQFTTPRETSSVQHFALSDGASIAYEVAGVGRPVLVCHGGPSTTHAYLRTDLEPLTSRHQLIFWDYRGSGSSSPASESSYTFERIADDAAELASALGHDSFDILAHSLGGFVALECVIRHPDRVRRLALIDTAPSGMAKRMALPTIRALGLARAGVAAVRGLRFLLFWSWRRESDDRTRSRFAIMATLQEGSREHRAAVRAREILANNDNAKHLERRSAEFDVLDKLRMIHQPALVVYGSRDAPFVAGAHLLLSGLPNVKELRLDGCGHHPLVEDNKRVTEAIEAFLA